MAQQWQFKQDASSAWHWTRIDEVEGRSDSPASFATHAQCMMDAVRFAVERRRTLPNVDGDTGSEASITHSAP